MKLSGNIWWLEPDDIREIHNLILLDKQLRGEEVSRPIESALKNVENSVHYGELQPDILEIAASYAVSISRAHSFIDGNKRTALVAMATYLNHHGYEIAIDAEKLARLMEQCAAKIISDEQLYDSIFEHLKNR